MLTRRFVTLLTLIIGMGCAHRPANIPVVDEDLQIFLSQSPALGIHTLGRPLRGIRTPFLCRGAYATENTNSPLFQGPIPVEFDVVLIAPGQVDLAKREPSRPQGFAVSYLCLYTPRLPVVSSLRDLTTVADVDAAFGFKARFGFSGTFTETKWQTSASWTAIAPNPDATFTLIDVFATAERPRAASNGVWRIRDIVGCTAVLRQCQTSKVESE